MPITDLQNSYLQLIGYVKRVNNRQLQSSEHLPILLQVLVSHTVEVHKYHINCIPTLKL